MSLRSRNIMFFLLCSGFIFLSYRAINNINKLESTTIHHTGKEISESEFADEGSKFCGQATPDNFKVAYNDSVVRLTRKNPYGFTKSIYDFYEEEYFHITVWRLGDNDDGVLVADGIGDSRFYYGHNKPSLVDTTNDWQLLTLDIQIPPHHHFNELRIYAWNNGNP